VSLAALILQRRPLVDKGVRSCPVRSRHHVCSRQYARIEQRHRSCLWRPCAALDDSARCRHHSILTSRPAADRVAPAGRCWSGTFTAGD